MPETGRASKSVGDSEVGVPSRGTPIPQPTAATGQRPAGRPVRSPPCKLICQTLPRICTCATDEPFSVVSAYPVGNPDGYPDPTASSKPPLARETRGFLRWYGTCPYRQATPKCEAAIAAPVWRGGAKMLRRVAQKRSERSGSRKACDPCEACNATSAPAGRGSLALVWPIRRPRPRSAVIRIGGA